MTAPGVGYGPLIDVGATPITFPLIVHLSEELVQLGASKAHLTIG